MINTILTQQTSVHSSQLAEHINFANPEATEMIANLEAKYNAIGMDGSLIAIQKIAGMVRQQAYLLSFIDVFMLLTVLFTALVFMALLLKKPKAPPKGAGGGGH